MPLAVLPVSIIMQRRALVSRWVDEAWSAVGVVAGSSGVVEHDLAVSDTVQHYPVNGFRLELHADENDGYYENWIAPQPKVFVMWRMQAGRAMPIAVSVSYGEGTRMLDSGEMADGVPMPAAVHAWLGDYLQLYYRPPRSGKKGHRAA